MLYCPLGLAGQTPMTANPPPCMREECAWWEEERNECAMRGIVRQLDFLSDSLMELQKHADAFVSRGEPE